MLREAGRGEGGPSECSGGHAGGGSGARPGGDLASRKACPSLQGGGRPLSRGARQLSELSEAPVKAVACGREGEGKDGAIFLA